MNHRILPLLCLALLAARFVAADAPPPAAAARPATGFEAFRLITERNIFDPNRTGRSARGSEEAPPRPDVISLVGTMHYDKGLVAFFDGSGAAFQKTLHEGESIAEYAVARIDQTGVELTRDGRRIPLRVGQQLRRPVGGDWAVVALETVRNEAEAQRSAATAAASPASPAAIPANASETLKRLMEQRQKQLKP